MAIGENMESWFGRPVVDWSPEEGITDPEGTIYRLRIDYDESDQGITWGDKIAQFLEDPNAMRVIGVIVGNWGEWGDESGDGAATVAESLVAARDRLPQLKALFIGDITYEECEISWIRQTDLSPLFEAFPLLEHFGARGGGGLSLGVPHHERLRSLTIETGGLPLSVLEEVKAAHLPALEHLELWLGTVGYGAEASVEDILPILTDGPQKWPHLTYLGLRDSDIADDIAEAIAANDIAQLRLDLTDDIAATTGGVPLLHQLKTLDLSLGTLSDRGAQALAACPAVAKLQKLDIHHHYVSPEAEAKIEALGIPNLDATDRKNPYVHGGEEHRYVAVGE